MAHSPACKRCCGQNKTGNTANQNQRCPDQKSGAIATDKPTKLANTTHNGGRVASSAAHAPATNHSVGRIVHSINHKDSCIKTCVSHPCSKIVAQSANSSDRGVATVPNIVMAYKFEMTDATENSAKNHTNKGITKLLRPLAKVRTDKGTAKDAVSQGACRPANPRRTKKTK